MIAEFYRCHLNNIMTDTTPLTFYDFSRESGAHISTAQPQQCYLALKHAPQHTDLLLHIVTLILSLNQHLTKLCNIKRKHMHLHGYCFNLTQTCAKQITISSVFRGGDNGVSDGDGDGDDKLSALVALSSDVAYKLDQLCE